MYQFLPNFLTLQADIDLNAEVLGANVSVVMRGGGGREITTNSSSCSSLEQEIEDTEKINRGLKLKTQMSATIFSSQQFIKD